MNNLEDELRQKLIKQHGREIRNLLKQYGEIWGGTHTTRIRWYDFIPRAFQKEEDEKRFYIDQSLAGNWSLMLWHGTHYPNFVDLEFENFYKNHVTSSKLKSKLF